MQDVNIGKDEVKGVWDLPEHFFVPSCKSKIISKLKSKLNKVYQFTPKIG